MKQTLYHVGKISKTHGYNGTLVIVADKPFGACMDELEELFLLIDGIMTPFPIEEFVTLTNTSAHVRLEFADSQNEALKLVGSCVYATVSLCEPDEAEYKRWIGYSVRDAKYGEAGIIREIEDYSGNVVMQIVDGKKETLISMYPGLITGIDEKSKIICITAPDGYF